jgi:hypothetical protein
MFNRTDYFSQHPFSTVDQLIHQRWAELLGGELVNNQITCPAPSHSAWDRGGRVLILSPQDPQFGPKMGYITHLFSPSEATLQAKLAFRDHVGAARRQAIAEVNDGVYAPLPARDYSYSTEKTPMPSWAWEKLKPATDTPVEAYLASRGLRLPPEHNRFVRYDPHAMYLRHADHHEIGQGGDREERVRAPAMVVLRRFLDTDEIANREATFLDARGHKLLDGNKTIRRPYVGAPTKNVATKMMPCPTNGRLAVGEGFETCLSVFQMLDYQLATWAVGSALNIMNLPIIDGVEELILLGENDKEDQSKIACEHCAERWRLYGRRVQIIYPSAACKDFNDELRRTAK